jgi:parallel beta-helix repeat protein
VEPLEDRRLLSTWTVTSTLDDGSTGTLRWAISQANAAGGAETINFSPTVFSAPQTITLGGTQLELSNTTGTETITGPAAGVTISGNKKSRVFQVDSGVTAALSGLTIAAGSATGAGGGLYNLGTTTLTNCTVGGNSAVNGGGVGTGSSGATTLTNCTVSGNSSNTVGGGVDNSGTTTLTNCTVSGNTAGTAGGGVAGATTLTNCTVSGNTGSAGGGMWIGTATLTNCTISGNSSTGEAGGLLVQGTTNLTDCTISGNSTRGPGGGLRVTNPGTIATLTNCTISGNSALSNGGGLDSESGGAMTLFNCTVSGNSASTGGGLYNANTMNVANTIVAGNTASGSGPDASGTIASQGNNLIGKTDGSSGWVGSDLTGTSANPLNALLAPLAYNGGPTQTIALLPGSPAIDAGNNALIPAGVATDQRGFLRIFNSTVDIGAYEVQPIPLVVNTTADGGGSPPGTLNLRTAVDLANTLSGPQTITFDPTVFATPQTITLAGTQLTLGNTTGTETIMGPAAGVTISGGGLSRVFQVDSGVTASISEAIRYFFPVIPGI